MADSDDEIEIVPHQEAPAEPKQLVVNEIDDEIGVVDDGTKQFNALIDLPHTRDQCMVFPLDTTCSMLNHRRCDNCYCWVCGVKASACQYWGVGDKKDDHCNAHSTLHYNQLRDKLKRMAKPKKVATITTLFARAAARPQQPAPAVQSFNARNVQQPLSSNRSTSASASLRTQPAGPGPSSLSASLPSPPTERKPTIKSREELARERQAQGEAPPCLTAPVVPLGPRIAVYADPDAPIPPAAQGQEEGNPTPIPASASRPLPTALPPPPPSPNSAVKALFSALAAQEGTAPPGLPFPFSLPMGFPVLQPPVVASPEAASPGAPPPPRGDEAEARPAVSPPLHQQQQKEEEGPPPLESSLPGAPVVEAAAVEEEDEEVIVIEDDSPLKAPPVTKRPTLDPPSNALVPFYNVATKKTEWRPMLPAHPILSLGPKPSTAQQSLPQKKRRGRPPGSGKGSKAKKARTAREDSEEGKGAMPHGSGERDGPYARPPEGPTLRPPPRSAAVKGGMQVQSMLQQLEEGDWRAHDLDPPHVEVSNTVTPVVPLGGPGGLEGSAAPVQKAGGRDAPDPPDTDDEEAGGTFGPGDLVGGQGRDTGMILMGGLLFEPLVPTRMRHR